MIIFTRHSLLKLKQRNISPQLVTKTFKSPDYQFTSCSNREVIYKKFNRLYLRVIYRREREDIIVITQYWTKRIKEKT